MPTCINLREKYGDQFKVEFEESREAEHGENARTADPRLMVLLCNNGHIAPWGGSLLAACTDRPGPVATKLQRLPFVDLEKSQIGDDGINAVFDVEHFETVVKIMQPRKRRRQSPEQRAASAERLRQFHPAKGERVQDVVARNAGAVHSCVPTG